MYAVVETGGRQYRVAEGDVLDLERLAGAPGDEVAFERVLGVGRDEGFVIGTPTVPGARVVGRVLAQRRGPKVVVYRYKAKANYRRKTGHRQELTRVRIVRIEA
jgi:large subunit ribosomal protein L21